MTSKAEFDKAIAAARAEGAAAELARISAILNAPESRGREASAIQLALQPSVSPAAARNILDTSEFGRGREIALALKR